MRRIFRLVGGLLRRINANRLRDAALARLRTGNPSCTIMSPDIYDSHLGEYVAILDHSVLSQVRVGNFSYVSNDVTLVNVEVGNFCSIAPHVQIGLAPHPSSVFVSTYPAFYRENTVGCPLSFRKNNIFNDSTPETIIDNDVWIGSNVIVPGGIHIGTGAIVAAGSVVVKDVPPYAIAGGNPAKIIRYRFTEGQIQFLLKLEWWNWPIEKILQHVDDFSDIDKLQARIGDV